MPYPKQAAHSPRQEARQETCLNVTEQCAVDSFPYGEEMLRQAFEVHEADEEAP